MKRFALAVLFLFSWNSNPSLVRAKALYHGYLSGTLSILKVGPEDVDLTDFVITVDATFQNPELAIQKQPDVSIGFGDYSASAHSEMSLSAVDPFNIREGDSLRIYVTTTGTADHGDVSFASSSAGIAATLQVINGTEQEVSVKTEWYSCEEFYSDGLHEWGEDASVGGSMEPGFLESCWSELLLYQYAPGTTSDLTVSAQVKGYASAVPEPSSVVIWILISVGGAAWAGTVPYRR